jgi:hypothetical protein
MPQVSLGSILFGGSVALAEDVGVENGVRI